MPDRGEGLAPDALLLWCRRHERRLALAWLVGTVVLLAAFALPPVRDRLLGLMQSAANRWDHRWTTRLQQGEQLVATKQWAAADGYLSQLDRDFPARNVRHGRDKQRERLLRLLAQAQEAEGRTGRTMATWNELVAFDSLNYASRFGYAQAAERLLSGWAPAVESRDGYAGALSLFPSHLPSVRGYIGYYMARGEFAPVTEAWQTYQDAWLVQPVFVTLGDTTLAVRIPVDGEPHEAEVALARPRQAGAELTFSAGGFAFDVGPVVLEPALEIGAVARVNPRQLDPAMLSGRGVHRAGAGWLPDSVSGVVTLPVPADLPSVARVRLTLTVFKPVDATLWKSIRTAYRNQLDHDGLDRSTRRTVPFPDVSSADSVIARLEWASEGLAPSPDE